MKGSSYDYHPTITYNFMVVTNKEILPVILMHSFVSDEMTRTPL